MLKRGSIGWVIWNVVESLLLIAGGVLCWIYCSSADFQKTALLIVGILLLTDAALRLTLGVVDVLKIGETAVYKTDYIQAVTGSLELALGIILILSYTEAASLEVVFKFVGLFLGIFLITIGAVTLIYAIVYLIKKLNSIFLNSASILGALVLIAGGVLAIIYLTKQSTIMTIFLVILGIVLVVCGAVLLFATISIAKKVKKVVKTADNIEKVVQGIATENAKEVDSEDVKDETK